MHLNSKEKRMKKDHSQRIRYVFIPLCMAMWTACMAALLPIPALAEPEGVQFETRTITDPQFGGVVTATVNVPKGWILEGKADWHFQNMDKPAYITFVVKSPEDDA